ncbi:hypothetical protein A0H81_00850 [Grifola frondosa]|uniref:Uncharacterized protein n=1 Tax=Grifola frondosa TaxID=5627 RepID=A0A1C7MPL2_GRIFR|nr:hypothetical protein A0H81_00850 [Grifola frondosa]
MPIPRSKSVPHVAFESTYHAHLSNDETYEHPKLPRHRSAITITPHFPAVYTPRTENVEDPFSLAGFFPANFNGRERQHQHSGYTSPISEEEEDSSVPTPDPFPAGTDDGGTGDAIKREDKLGVLALNTLLLPSIRLEDLHADHRLLSPYSEHGDPLDDEALYHALCALREAHSHPLSADLSEESAALDELFCPWKESDDKDVEFDGWEALVFRGVSRIMDFLSGF